MKTSTDDSDARTWRDDDRARRYVEEAVERERLATDPVASLERARMERAAALEKSVARSGMPAKTVYDALHVELGEKQLGVAKDLEAITERKTTRSFALITGGVGVGKTLLAVREGIRYIRSGLGGVRYALFSRLLRDIRATYADRSRSESAVLYPLLGANLLIIDDVGAEKPSEFSARILFDLVDHRYQRGASTIITSNFGPSRLAKHLAITEERVVADRIIDRLVESATWFELTGPSWRDAAATTTRDWKAIERLEQLQRDAQRFTA